MVGLLVETDKSIQRTKFLINCGGLYADRIAHKPGVGLNYCIIPFKGEYYKLNHTKQYLVKSHIYPTPNIEFPFLGVHISKKVNGDIHILNAVSPALTCSLPFANYIAKLLDRNFPL